MLGQKVANLGSLREYDWAKMTTASGLKSTKIKMEVRSLSRAAEIKSV